MPLKRKSSDDSESARKKREHLLLAREIENKGFEIDPCSYYKKEEQKYIILEERSDRCSECVRLKRKCNVSLSLADR